MDNIYRFDSFDDNSYPKQVGVIRMVRELEYHHKKYLLNKADVKIEDMKFDIFAYLSVIGRIYYFLSSNSLLDLTPTINDIIIIRHKFVAHRSVDAKKTKGKAKIPIEFDTAEYANQIDFIYSGTTKDENGDVILPKLRLVYKENGEHIELPLFSIAYSHKIIVKEINLAIETYNKPFKRD